MYPFVKKLSLSLLMCSNLAFLGLIFYTYFENQNPTLLFSVVQVDLETQIKEECGEQLKQVLEDQKSSYICNIKTKQKHREASYSLKTKIKVSKNKEGIFVVEGQGHMTNKMRHATEAKFCDNCTTNSLVTESNFQKIMEQVINVAEKIQTEAKSSVLKARNNYKKKHDNKKMTKSEKFLCKARWNKETQKYEKFTLEEQLNCKVDTISNLNLPLNIETYYHNKLKTDFWHTALSEDAEFLNEHLDKFSDPYKYAFSVRASTGLIQNFLNWRENFETLDSEKAKEDFIKQIKQEVAQMTSFMTKQQAQADLYFLNQGFNGLFTTRTSSSVPKKTGNKN